MVASATRKGRNVSKASAEGISKALDIKLKGLFTPVGENGKLSERTVLHHYRLISAILTSAIVDDTILQSNPAKRVRPPKYDRTEVVCLDDVQAAHLLELIDAEPMEFKTAIKLLLFTGMRRGEALGLKWQDIDFDSSLLSVRRASQYTPTKGIFVKVPKTQSSVRTIKVPTIGMLSLKEFKKWQNKQRLALGDLWEDGDWLFTSWSGNPIHPDTLSSLFSTFIKTTGLPQIHIQSLRHTNATLLIAGGENVRTVSRRLGHSQTSTTLNIYSHAIESADAKAAQTLENIFSPTVAAKK